MNLESFSCFLALEIFISRESIHKYAFNYREKSAYEYLITSVVF